ncbi:MAG TPA: YicC/YloC family endoribonuclease, partial [Rhizomicrobium sp.]|nr:YicC/YloC family endoribonuclease [Rhizomicrobium sp.]
MTFASMTGFAESAGSHEGVRWRWEAKSVNGRSLDMRLRTPPGYDGLEAPARRLAGERFLRGAFQISLTVEEQEAARGLRVDAAALASAVRIAREVAAETGMAPARVDGLLALKGVIVADEGAVPLDPVIRAHRDAAILESLAAALDKLVKERCSEGAKLAALLTAQMNGIEKLVGEAGRLAAAQPQVLRARLNAQLKELLDAAPVSEDRLAQEVALLAVKADVREE